MLGRKVGRPRNTWGDKVRQDFEILGVDEKMTVDQRR